MPDGKTMEDIEAMTLEEREAYFQEHPEARQLAYKYSMSVVVPDA